MKHVSLTLLAAITFISAGIHAANSEPVIQLAPSAELIEKHMSYLASDDMQGREAGTPGYDKAADYVTAQFKELGLAPGGDNGSYFQEVPLRRSLRDSTKARLVAKNADGEIIPLVESIDYHVGGSKAHAASQVEAEVVFAGFGLV